MTTRVTTLILLLGMFLFDLTGYLWIPDYNHSGTSSVIGAVCFIACLLFVCDTVLHWYVDYFYEERR